MFGLSFLFFIVVSAVFGRMIEPFVEKFIFGEKLYHLDSDVQDLIIEITSSVLIFVGVYVVLFLLSKMYC